MSTTARRVAIVTSRFPFGTQEAYLSAELEQLTRYFERLAVVPVRPPQCAQRHRVPPGVEIVAWPLVSTALLRRAARAVRRQPERVRHTLLQVLGSRDPGRIKNCAVAIKALALADWAIEHEIDHIHAYWSSTPATVAMIAASVAGIAWSATAHRWDIYERNAFDVKARSVAFIRTISRRGTNDLRVRMPQLNGRVLELRLGSEIGDCALPRPPGSEFRIACPAALVPVKGHATLLEALALLRKLGAPVACTLFGKGPLERTLRDDVERLGLTSAVEFAGFVPQQQLRDAYRAGRFAAVVLASRNAGEKMMEGVPAALIEAMACGVPVIVTNSGSIGELIDDQCGTLVRADDPAQLAGAIYDVLVNAAAAAARARRAYDVVLERHDVRTQMRLLAEALQRRSTN